GDALAGDTAGRRAGEGACTRRGRGGGHRLTFRLAAVLNGVPKTCLGGEKMMKARHALLLPLFTLLAACGAEKAETVAIDAKRIRAHMEFLADDLLEGRNTGERGHEIAAAYFATQCKLMGLEPAGEEGSYFQQVPFRSSRLVEATGTLTLQGGARALVAPNDIRVDASHAAVEESGSGTIVFAGWGISAPEFGYDDYASLDVEGKVVML